jgi:hypothetical protein
MAVTFKVSDVKRATQALSLPQLHARQTFLNEPAEAWGCSAGRFESTEQNGFLSAVQLAYSDHRPLVLTPDAVWLCIARGFAQHVTANAEQLRGKFVRHKEQEKLAVDLPGFVKGSRDNKWPEVFGQFSDAIAEHIGRQRDLVVCAFSTTGPVERAASEIVLMDAMRHYFWYYGSTLCGIPEITLEGTAEDWLQIRRRARALEEYELAWWTSALDPVLDQFALVAAGKEPDLGFWRSMFKLDDASGGPYVTGWINVLFPYVVGNPPQEVMEQAMESFDAFTMPEADLLFDAEDKEYLEEVVKNLPEQGMEQHLEPPYALRVPVPLKPNWATTHWERALAMPFGGGPEETKIPAGLAVVPFTWDYLDTRYAMEFLGGFVGITQDEGSLAVRPAIGWAVRDAKSAGG